MQHFVVIANVFMLGFLGVAWSKNSLLNVAIKFALFTLALCNLLLILQASGYVIKLPS